MNTESKEGVVIKEEFIMSTEKLNASVESLFEKNGSNNSAKSTSRSSHYVDHSDDPIYEIPSSEKKKGGIKVLFPEKLHSLLSSKKFIQDRSVIGWAHHGRSFFIRNPEEFVGSVLPCDAHSMFSHTTFSSFQRQMNLYGFRRIRKSGTSDEGGYYHELFLQGRPDLCLKMRRVAVKGFRSESSNVDSYDIPKFHLMKPCVNKEGGVEQNGYIADSLPGLRPPRSSFSLPLPLPMLPGSTNGGIVEESFGGSNNLLGMLGSLTQYQNPITPTDSLALRELALREYLYKNEIMNRAIESSRRIRELQLIEEIRQHQALQANELSRNPLLRSEYLRHLQSDQNITSPQSETLEILSRLAHGSNGL